MASTPQLPHSPLTHEELNRRAAEAINLVGHHAAAVMRDGGGKFNDRDRVALAKHTARFDDWQAAAIARCSR
jgi:hypothetical protein